MMFLWKSSRSADYHGRLLDDREDLGSDMSFEATDDFGLLHSLNGSATYVARVLRS